jgi:hypothetical protein
MPTAQLPAVRERQRWPAARFTGNSIGRPPAQGYVDIYRMLAWLSVGMVACALLLNKNKPGEEAPAGAAG